MLTDTELLTVSRDELVAALRQLQGENIELTSELLSRSVLEVENERLRDLLGIRSGNEVFSLVASVVVRPPETPYGLMVIDRGTRDGLVVGDLVRSSRKEILGEVVAIEESLAKVLLYSAPDQTRSVLLGADELPVSALGLGGAWRIEVPQESVVAVGDSVVSDSSERFVLGYVISIDDREGEPFKYVYAAPSVNIQELTWVDIARLE